MDGRKNWSRMMTMSDTRERIMSAARLTVQDRGYSGLSFRDLAKEVGIKSASIHHYFPTKGELGAVLADRYTADLVTYLEGLLEQGLDQESCMRKYTEVFRNTLLNENRMCMAGILAAEHRELPDEVKAGVVAYGEMNMRWLMKVLSLGPDAGTDMAAIEQRARAIYAAIQGAQLISRSRGDIHVYDTIIDSYRQAGLFP
jgi:TetR/AcrR family transcriptional repressor of nem operon